MHRLGGVRVKSKQPTRRILAVLGLVALGLTVWILGAPSAEAQSRSSLQNDWMSHEVQSVQVQGFRRAGPRISERANFKPNALTSFRLDTASTRRVDLIRAWDLQRHHFFVTDARARGDFGPHRLIVNVRDRTAPRPNSAVAGRKAKVMPPSPVPTRAEQAKPSRPSPVYAPSYTVQVGPAPRKLEPGQLVIRTPKKTVLITQSP